jgi:MFS family permease
MPVTSKLSNLRRSHSEFSNISCSVQEIFHTTPLLTAAWFSPLAGGGIVIALVGGFVLHIFSGRILMMISGAGFLLSGLLFAILPAQSDGNPSTNFLYWAYIFPAMLGGTIGVDIQFNVTNIYISTAMPRRHQATASALINSLLYLGFAFWLGVADLAVSTTSRARGEDLDLRGQYQIAFWTAVGLSVLATILISKVKFGRAASDLTADEKAELAREEEIASASSE